MPGMRPAKRQKRNAVEAIDNAGAAPVRTPAPSLPRKRREVKAAGASGSLHSESRSQRTRPATLIIGRQIREEQQVGARRQDAIAPLPRS